MSFAHRIAFILAVGVLPAAASAEAFDVKTGLWESTLTIESRGAPPVDLSKLSPERRARIEAALKKQEAQGPRKHTIVDKHCVTSAELSERPFDKVGSKLEEQGETCKTTVVTSTRKHWHGRISCVGQAAIVGDLNFEAISREQVRGIVTSHAANDARALSTQATISARWLGAACPKK